MKSFGAGNDVRKVSSLLGIGIQLTATILAFAALGWWLDTKFETQPWLLLAGLVFGATGGMMSFIRTALNIGTSKQKSVDKRSNDQMDASAKGLED
ncbi:MAG: AtpZ/AtpI family protein [Chlorobi bacterium]|nr:AtpZ/AtpI family protein [Chlorobiota bacterium]